MNSRALEPQHVNSCVKKGHLYTMLAHYPQGTAFVHSDGNRYQWPPRGCYTLIETGADVAHDADLFVPVEEDQVDETETVYEREKVLVELKDKPNGTSIGTP